MDKVFMVLASNHGYSKTLFGIYSEKPMAEIRIEELKKEWNYDVYEVEEIILNAKILIEF